MNAVLSKMKSIQKKKKNFNEKLKVRDKKMPMDSVFVVRCEFFESNKCELDGGGIFLFDFNSSIPNFLKPIELFRLAFERV